MAEISERAWSDEDRLEACWAVAHALPAAIKKGEGTPALDVFVDAVLETVAHKIKAAGVQAGREAAAADIEAMEPFDKDGDDLVPRTAAAAIARRGMR